MTQQLIEALKRVEAWPAEMQDEFAEFVLEIDTGFCDYEPTPEELAGILHGLRDVAKAAWRRRSRSKPPSQNS
jgi:hypothetical protein